ncbi:MAG: hypothetical protein ABS87_02030 [Sphingomonas sp. SCN 67-18]|uniref:SRPBCC family protein n=1 Tax=uncultured Sphingomonas sp. TaxID=158754 RepID=UPI0008693FBB|nr:SRPBCC domain-containing protein [Sphingomonas sp. SCN 67-18]ODU22473.1 MAG: hypothetical protein ABS87_02030 [Sphingomonas sp. SCN 67-18]
MRNGLMMLGVALLAVPAGAPALAEVEAVSEVGFSVVHVVTVPATPEAVYAALKMPAKWWGGAHSWSGDAANLWMDAQAGGCFCETLPGAARGSVEHGRIIHAAPGRLLRLTGALGPLQGEAVTGTLSWELSAVDGGTRISQSYVVGGHARMGMAAIAPAVDGVLGEQLDRLKAFIETPGG